MRIPLSILFLVWIVQNVLLLFSLFIEPNDGDFSPLFLPSLYLDVLIFSTLIIIGIGNIILSPETRMQYTGNPKRNWLIIIIGCLIFIYMSLLWRYALDFYPIDYLELITSGYLSSTRSDSEALPLEAYIGVLRVSNFGLFLISLGLFLETGKGSARYLVLFYGIANFILTIAVILVFFKFFTTLLIIPFLIKVTLDGLTKKHGVYVDDY
jgi:hypothetical protein